MHTKLYTVSVIGKIMCFFYLQSWTVESLLVQAMEMCTSLKPHSPALAPSPAVLDTECKVAQQACVKRMGSGLDILSAKVRFICLFIVLFLFYLFYFFI